MQLKRAGNNLVFTTAFAGDQKTLVASSRRGSLAAIAGHHCTMDGISLGLINLLQTF